MYLAVGLGNPEPIYIGNRHNVGKMAVESLARKNKVLLDKHGYYNLGKFNLNNHQLLLATTNVFVNESGIAVAEMCRENNLSTSKLIVIHDDLDLPFSSLRVKQGGSSGGHNGLKSIISTLGKDDFIRIRIGIGRPPGKMDPAEFVLSDFTSREFTEIEVTVSQVVDVLTLIITEGVTSAMQHYNKRQ